MNNDLISREALRKQIDDYKYFYSSFEKMTVAEFLTIVHEFIDNAPTIPQTIITEFKGCDNCELERPKGKWIDVKDIPYLANCSNCGYQMDTHEEHGYFNYCPYCGADMRGEKNE